MIIASLGVGIVGATKGFDINRLATGLFNSEKSKLQDLMISFLEDIQFKDFQKAASYHSSEDQKNANIPKLIEEKFKIKPELMDIREYQIEDVDIDRSGNRARIRTMTHVKILNSDELRDIESIFYWHKTDGVWNMQLKSSL